MQKKVSIPDVTLFCEQCEENASFQLQIGVEVEKSNRYLTTDVSAVWFCTECHEQEVSCELEEGRVVFHGV
jgi:hypothetical protein